MAGRKVFTSGEILTAADVNSYLMDQSVMVFADSTARSSAIPTPTEGMVTYREDANRVEVYDGASFGPIGGILQVVSTTKTDTFSTTSTSNTDVTGFSLSITPSSTSSKILLFLTIGAVDNLTNVAANTFRVLRDATPVGVGGSSVANGTLHVTPDGDRASSISWSFYDSPSTTSSITYKVQAKTTSGTLVINRNGANTQFTISTITALEVAV